MASFVWYVENLNDEPVEVSLMFTWQAGSGRRHIDSVLLQSMDSNDVSLASEEFSCKNISHQSLRASDGDDLTGVGVSIKQTLRDMNLEYCILAKKEVRPQS